VINVDNVSKSVEFYNNIGVKATEDDAQMPGMPSATVGTINVGDSGIIIWNKHNIPPDQPEDTRAWTSGELGKGVLFTIGVPNAKKVWEKVQKARVEVDTPIEAQPWGGHGFNIVDPDGYVINITDKFPGMTPPKKVARAAKKVVRKVTGKSKPKRKGR